MSRRALGGSRWYGELDGGECTSAAEADLLDASPTRSRPSDRLSEGDRDSARSINRPTSIGG